MRVYGIDRGGAQGAQRKTGKRYVIPAIKDRLAAAYKPGIGASALRSAVFPPELFPHAYAYAAGGGPPGCHRAFISALRRYGYTSDAHRRVWRARKAPRPA